MQRISMDNRPSTEGYSRKVVVALASKDTKCNYNHNAEADKEGRK